MFSFLTFICYKYVSQLLTRRFGPNLAQNLELRPASGIIVVRTHMLNLGALAVAANLAPEVQVQPRTFVLALGTGGSSSGFVTQLGAFQLLPTTL